MKFTVSDMDCGGCANALKNAIQEHDAKAVITADVSKHSLSVETSLSQDKVSEIISEAGYQPQIA